MTEQTALAQLRHLYQNMVKSIVDQRYNIKGGKHGT